MSPASRIASAVSSFSFFLWPASLSVPLTVKILHTSRLPSHTSSPILSPISFSSPVTFLNRRADSFFSCPPSTMSMKKLTFTILFVREWKSSQTPCKTLGHGVVECVPLYFVSVLQCGLHCAQLITIKKTTTQEYPPPTFEAQRDTSHTPAHKDFREKYFQGFKPQSSTSESPSLESPKAVTSPDNLDG